jgi:hypothetical protein
MWCAILDRPVQEERVVVVACEVLGARLPVRVHHPALWLAEYLPPLRRLAEHEVEVPLHVAEVLRQRRGLRVEAREDESVEALDVGSVQEPPLATVEVLAVAGLEERRAVPLAGVLVRPAVVGAAEVGGVALRRPADHRAAMPAAIEQDAQDPVLAADEHERVPADVTVHVVAPARHLGLEPDEHPRPCEDPVELPLVRCLVRDHPGRQQSELQACGDFLKTLVQFCSGFHRPPPRRRSRGS